MPTISSISNERLKRVRALRARKERERTGLAFVEGIRPVAAAVELDAEVELLLVAPDLLRSDFARASVTAARARGIDVVELSPGAFATISQRDGPQGIAAVARQRWEPLDAIAPAAGDCWVVLSAVADPGNLGAVLRTCDATGAPGVMLLDAAADPYDPVAMRASTGAIFSRRLARASWEAFAAWARATGLPIVGAAGDAPRAYRDVEYPSPLALLLGSEREGLTAAQRERCVELVRIPLAGTVDSLNLAVAAGVLLYEVHEQRVRAADEA